MLITCLHHKRPMSAQEGLLRRAEGDPARVVCFDTVVLQIRFWLPEAGSLSLLLTVRKLVSKDFSRSAGLSGIVPIYTRIADCSVFGRKCRCSAFWICSKYVKSFIQKQVPAWNQVRRPRPGKVKAACPKVIQLGLMTTRSMLSLNFPTPFVMQNVSE